MTDPIERVPSPLVSPTAPAAAPAAAPQAGGDSPAFRRLLESLEQLARPAAAPPEVHDADSLQQAMAHADDGFREVMDLRRRLEEAFRQRTS